MVIPLELRPLPQHGPPQPGAGLRVGLLGGGAALSLLLSSVFLACGGGDDDSPVASPTAGKAQRAADAVPRLTDLGFAIVQQGKDPLVPATQDMVKAGYQKAGPPARSVVIRIYFEPTVPAAEKLFGTIAAAYGQMPLQALIEQDPSRTLSAAGAPANKDTVSPPLGDQQKSYVTIRADTQGNGVWTDVYRFGRVVTVVQLLENATANQDSLRKELVARVQARLP